MHVPQPCFFLLYVVRWTDVNVTSIIMFYPLAGKKSTLFNDIMNDITSIITGTVCVCVCGRGSWKFIPHILDRRMGPSLNKGKEKKIFAVQIRTHTLVSNQK